MALLVLVTIASAAIAGTLFDRAAAFALLDRIVMPFVGFVAAPLILCDHSSKTLLLRGLTISGLYVGATAVISVWGPEALLFPRYLADSSVGIAQGRARGPSAEAVGTGLLVITCGAAAATVATRERGFWRAVSLLTIVVCVLSGLLSLTRSIWLAMVVATLCVGLAAPRARRVLWQCALAALTLVVVVLSLVPGLLQSASSRLNTSRSLDDRAYTNDAAARIILEHPFLGVGWRNFIAESPNYIVQSDTGPLTNVGIEVHNLFLSRGAELGIPGLLLTVAVIIAGPVVGLMARRENLKSIDGAVWLLAVAAFSAWTVVAFFTGVSFAFANLLVWSIAGLAYANNSDLKEPGEQEFVYE